MAHRAVTLDANGEATPWYGVPHGVGDVAFHLTGTFVATVTFEACVEGNEANATPIAVSAIATPGTLVTTAAAAGLFKTQNGWAGGLKVRARITAYTSGSVVIRASSSE
jgi:hypothetical protein